MPWYVRRHCVFGFLLVALGTLGSRSAMAELIPLAPVRLNLGRGNVKNFDVTPDGRNVFFIARPTIGGDDFRLFQSSTTDGIMTDRSLQPSGQRIEQLAIAPDGQSVVYRQTDHISRGNAFIVPVAGGSPKQLTFNNEVSENLFTPEFRFSTDSQQIAIFGSRKLSTVAADGASPVRQLNTGDVLYQTTTASWDLSPSGTSVYFTQQSTPGGKFDLYEADFAGGTPQKINTTSNMEPQSYQRFVAPASGESIVYGARNGARSTVYRKDFLSGSEVDLTPTLPSQKIIRFQGVADEHVVFAASDTVGALGELYSVPLAGGELLNLSQLAGASATTRFTISPTSASLVFAGITSPGRFGVFLADLATNSVESLSQKSGDLEYPGITYSPNGGYFTVAYEYSGVSLFRSDGTFVRHLDASQPMFDPSGEYLFYVDFIYNGTAALGNVLFMEPVDGSSERTRLSTEDEYHTIYAYRFSDDGSTVVYRADSALYSVRFVPEPSTFLVAAFGLAALIGAVARRRAR